MPVTVSVLKTKYGLKSLRWSAPELANGGEIKQTGLTTADITLPENIFMDRSGGPQGCRVTAVGEDNEGNPSNTAEMWVNVIPSVETITSPTVTPTSPWWRITAISLPLWWRCYRMTRVKCWRTKWSRSVFPA